MTDAEREALEVLTAAVEEFVSGWEPQHYPQLRQPAEKARAVLQANQGEQP